MSCNQNKELEQVKVRISIKYPYLQPNEVDDCFNVALANFMSIRYPYKNSRPKMENLEMDFVECNWVYERMEDILSRAGVTNLVAYKENGISFTFAGSNIDPTLVSRIMPKGSVPK